MNRPEAVLLGFFLACWLTALLHIFRLLSIEGLLPLSLQGLYAIAAALGWLGGNVYMHRRRRLDGKVGRRRLLLVYLFGPPGLASLLWAASPAAVQAISPLVPLYAFAVATVFFLVPTTLRGWPG